MKKERDIQVQEAQIVPNSIKPDRYIIIKMAKLKDNFKRDCIVFVSLFYALCAFHISPIKLLFCH